MNPRVMKVTANPDFTLTLVFDNKETRIFDVKPYMEFDVFQELKALDYFNSAAPFMGSISWPHGQDFCPDTLYEDGVPIDRLPKANHPATR